MLISTSRSLTRFFARNAGDESFYPNLLVDTAFQTAADELILRAGLLPRTDPITLTAAAATLSVAIARFRPDRLMEVFLTGSNVQVSLGATRWDAWKYTEGAVVGSVAQSSSATLDIVDHAVILDRQIGSPQTGQPQAIAFRDWSNTTATLLTYPIADQNYTGNLRWCDQLTAWTAGSPLILPTIVGGQVFVAINNGGLSYGSPPAITFQGDGTGAAATCTLDANGSINAITMSNNGANYTHVDVLVNGIVSTDLTLNLPDDFARNVALYGAPAFLQHNDPEHAYATVAGQKFEAYIQRAIGMSGGMGTAKVVSARRRR